jgi:hypothetical protein
MEGQMDVQEIFAILHKWGIHTLGQLAALDKEQLGVRLGPEAICMWERANGRSSRLLKLIRPPESFQESFEFEREIETAEPLLFMLRRFLEQLAVRLAAIYLVAKELMLRITLANKQTYERVFKIPQPTNDVDLLFRMLQTHLENFRSEHPIVAVALSAEPIRAAGEQFGLFETTLRNPHQLSETLARLTALLGGDRIGTPVLEETHRPDAFHMQPFSWAVVESASSAVATAKEDALSRVNRKSQRTLQQRCAAFGRQYLPLSCRMKMHRHTFAVPKSPKKSSRNAAHIFFPETGGTKNRGDTQSGIFSWIMVKCSGVTNRRDLGRSMGFMISNSW